MRFYEYESKEIVRRGGIPTSKGGFAKTAAEARARAEEVDGPVVVKSQVLTGGRMKAGGVKFADSPDEAERLAAEILQLEINGHMPRGALVDERVEVAITGDAAEEDAHRAILRSHLLASVLRSSPCGSLDELGGAARRR